MTRFNSAQMNAIDLPSYVANQHPVSNTDVVVWYKGSLHHLVRDEDGEFVGGLFRGEAHVTWTGWILKPHNLFDRTPLFP